MLLIGGIAWIVYNIVVWRTAEFAVTNLRVLRYEGFMQRRSSETLLTSVSDVKLNVGLVGKSLGYGDLQIFTQSGDAGADSFTSIVKPAEFRNAMMTVKLQDQAASRPAARRPLPHRSLRPLRRRLRPRRPPAPRTRRRASSGWRSCATRASSRPRSSRRRRRRSSPGCSSAPRPLPDPYRLRRLPFRRFDPAFVELAGSRSGSPSGSSATSSARAASSASRASSDTIG